uniref:Secreted protein n=1 Tax=Panagrellus redivivus TaxID=6233 RepID=A0A7E4ZW54_PANRE
MKAAPPTHSKILYLQLLVFHSIVHHQGVFPCFLCDGKTSDCRYAKAVQYDVLVSSADGESQIIVPDRRYSTLHKLT